MLGSVLEYAALYSLKTEDIPSFERHFAQLQTYYQDASLAESERKYLILGLNLMHLLVVNRLYDFHTSLELIPLDQRSNPFVKYPVQVRHQCLTVLQ